MPSLRAPRRHDDVTALAVEVAQPPTGADAELGIRVSGRRDDLLEAVSVDRCPEELARAIIVAHEGQHTRVRIGHDAAVWPVGEEDLSLVALDVQRYQIAGTEIAGGTRLRVEESSLPADRLPTINIIIATTTTIITTKIIPTRCERDGEHDDREAHKAR